MTDQRPDGLYQCTDCERTFDSEVSLLFCCNPRFDKPAFERSDN